MSQQGKYTYFGEGNAHILVKEAQNVSELLRLPKMSEHPSERRTKEKVANLWARAVGNQSLLGVNDEVCFSKTQYSHILSHVESARPEARRRTGAIVPIDCVGCRVPNMCAIGTTNIVDMCDAHHHGSDGTALRTREQCHSHSLTFEIKVKYGLHSISAFVPCESDGDAHGRIPDPRSIKRTHGRFQLMQLFKRYESESELHGSQEDTVLPDWGTFTTLSRYDPCDLCSQSATRMAAALNALVESPQNNLRAWLNGVAVEPQHPEMRMRGALDNACREFLEACKCREGQEEEKGRGEEGERGRERERERGGEVGGGGLMIVLDALQDVLYADGVLARLQIMQALDRPLDIEGTEAVLCRLVELHGGVLEQALSDVRHNIVVTMLPLTPGTGTGIDAEDLEENEKCALADYWHLDDLAHSTQSSQSDRRTMALACVQRMPRFTCVWMLQVFLVSLAAKDASVMVCFRTSEWESAENDRGRYAIVKLIDTDPKPVTKIVQRCAEEEQICTKAAVALKFLEKAGG